ncbi:frizzled-5-like [Panonychus citri]|uniref:frizzled-5-like n=1 Tax=Panonychus citri TaxID=50023 RepID=UPI002307F9CF|nr:frizzled-5-like [Panonychus citri]
MDFISSSSSSSSSSGSLITTTSSFLTTTMGSIFNSHLLFSFILTNIIVLRASHLVSTAELYPESRPKCEEIVVPMCRGIGYNMTSMPNQFHHEKQDEAGLEAHQFWPLVEINCSDDLRFFLCSMYTPICMEDYHSRLPACRSVCERAKSGCATIMLQYGFPWPESMDCNNFPPYGSPNQLCMDQKEGASPSISSSPPSLPPSVFVPSVTLSPPLVPTTSSSKSTNKTSPSNIGPTKFSDLFNGKSFDKSRNGCNCQCRYPLITIHEPTDPFRIISTGGVVNCAQSCDSSPFFSQQDQSKSLLFISLTAFLCLICSLLVVCTYFSDRSRFCYPERAIIFLSGCYIMISIGFLLRYHLGHSAIACDGGILRYPGIGIQSINCITVFIFIYFFGMAASLWWVILTLAWVLAASLKWSTEAIETYSWNFHIFAWGLPAIKSFFAISYMAVDSEPLAGICTVGNLNPKYLMYFIIAPLLAYLTLGILFLLFGLFSLMRLRRSIRKHVRQVTDKTGLVKLMVRIIIFSILYIVPTIVVIICNIYLYTNSSSWEVNHNCPCNSASLETPYVTIHLFKYVMTLVVGITTCFWILSWKTIKSWWYCTAGKLCCCCRKEAPIPRDPLMGSTGGGSSQYIVNSQRSYKQINQIAHSSVSGGQPHRKI